MSVRKVVIRIPNLYDKDFIEHRAIAIQQTEMCQPHFALGAYQWLYWDAPARGQGRQIADWIAAYEMEPIAWADLEDKTKKTPRQITKHIRQFVEGADMECGIYTARGWWNQYQPGVVSDLKLWDADWIGDGELIFPHPVADLGNMTPYGGWTQRHMRQYGWAVIGGVTVDVNVFRVRD